MAFDIASYALSKKYTSDSLKGGGSVVGKNVIISSIVPIDGGNRITFSYTLDDGTEKTSTMDVMDGKDGGTGEQGIQGLKGEKGDQGEQGIQGIQGIQGEKGDDGYPFLIYKEYTNISEFNAGDFPEIGLMFMIKSDDITSFPVYRYTGDEINPYSHVTNLTSSESIKGDKGDKGDTGEQGVAGEDGKDGITYSPTIGTVVSGNTANVNVTVDDDTYTAKFDFVLPKGDKGDKGDIGDEGITPHIDETTKRWFIGKIDTGIIAEGQDGETGADGRSITSIEKDSDENIIVTFSDGTTQNIGKLVVNIQGDFLTSNGFGNLRYYNGIFQYYDTTTSSWIDTSITTDNVYIINMTPQSMKKMICIYDTELCKYKLKWQEPGDTIIDGQVSCIVEKVIIRRKQNSVPIDENDGDLVVEINRKDFGTHKDNFFIDTELTPNDGDIYYYKAFPLSTTGFYNNSPENETDGIVCKDYYLFGFKLDQNESDPANMITYIEDNKCFTSSYMDYNTDTFRYNDWTVESGAWFMDVKPCMLKYDGTVDYFLNPNDYSKKLDNEETSDYNNDSYEGNVMIQFPKVYWKIVDNSDDTFNIYVSNKKIDNDFVCWSHTDNNGNEIDYCYMPVYNGSLINNKLRSISDKTPMGNKTVDAEITYAKANNLTDDIIWYTETYNDRMLVNILLLLIGKSTDTQTIFGLGNNNSYTSTSSTGVKKTGTMDSKGLFWGDTGNKTGVKVFGIEHWWGNMFRRIAGHINNKGIQKIKLTYGQSDGSTTDGYNLDGTGYIEVPDFIISTSSSTSGYINKMTISCNCLIPIVASGSSTTYYCDGLWYNNSVVGYSVVGGNTGYTYSVGALCLYICQPVSYDAITIGASLSCKPLALTVNRR